MGKIENSFESREAGIEFAMKSFSHPAFRLDFEEVGEGSDIGTLIRAQAGIVASFEMFEPPASTIEEPVMELQPFVTATSVLYKGTVSPVRPVTHQERHLRIKQPAIAVELVPDHIRGMLERKVGSITLTRSVFIREAVRSLIKEPSGRNNELGRVAFDTSITTLGSIWS